MLKNVLGILFFLFLFGLVFMFTPRKAFAGCAGICSPACGSGYSCEVVEQHCGPPPPNTPPDGCEVTCGCVGSGGCTGDSGCTSGSPYCCNGVCSASTCNNRTPYDPVNCSSLKVNGTVVDSTVTQTLNLGQNYLLDASYNGRGRTQVARYMKVTTGTSGCNTTSPPGYSSYWGYNSGSRTNIPQFNQVWTPTIAGTYTISCGIRAYDDGYGACFWKDCSSGTNIQYGGNYYCPGPNNYVTVIVPQPVGCDPNSWTNCTKACGGGTQVNACGTPRNCNTQSCNPGWWQVKDGDVSSYGDLDSNVPSSYYFELSGPGGYPGIPGYGGDPRDTNLSSSNVSTVGWLANSTFTSTKVYDSTYFLNAIPATTTINNITATTFDQTKLNAGTVDSGGYTWFMYDGNSYGNTDLTVSALSLTTKKVILIVKNADIIIGGTIHLTKGAGFFLAISTGDINIANTVGGAGVTPGDLEGIFVASGNVNTGTTGAQNDKQLWIRGSVISYGEADNTGINLQRDMGASNLTTPGEYFEFAPDLEILFPKVLSRYPSNWREVAP